MTEAATAATTHGAKRLSGRKSAPVRYSGRCHTPHARDDARAQRTPAALQMRQRKPAPSQLLAARAPRENREQEQENGARDSPGDIRSVAPEQHAHADGREREH